MLITTRIESPPQQRKSIDGEMIALLDDGLFNWIGLFFLLMTISFVAEWMGQG